MGVPNNARPEKRTRKFVPSKQHVMKLMSHNFLSALVSVACPIRRATKPGQHRTYLLAGSAVAVFALGIAQFVRTAVRNFRSRRIVSGNNSQAVGRPELPNSSGSTPPLLLQVSGTISIAISTAHRPSLEGETGTGRVNVPRLQRTELSWNAAPTQCNAQSRLLDIAAMQFDVVIKPNILLRDMEPCSRASCVVLCHHPTLKDCP